MVMGVARM